MRLITLGVTGFVSLVLISLGFGSFYTVDQGEMAVLLRYGEIQSVAGPGLHGKWPLIEDVAILSTRTQKKPYPTGSYSKDVQTAQLVITINYRIDPSKVKEIYSNYKTLDVAIARIVEPKVLATSKIVFGRYNAAVAISERGRLNLEMEKEVRESITEPGIILEALVIEDITFSDGFNNAIEARMKTEVEVAQKEQELRKREVDANMVRVAAKGEADARVAKAKAEAEAIRLQGLAEAEAIAARGKALRDNPNLIGLVSAEKWNGVLPTTMVPEGSVPFVDVTKNITK